MTMLGAQLDDLERLTGQLHSTAGDIGEVRVDAITTSHAVVSQVKESAQRALTEIDAAMERLRSSVLASTDGSQQANWSGANRDRFVEAANRFDTSMSAAESATHDTYTEFQATIHQMADQLDSYTTSLGSSLEEAARAAESMANAVDQQRANLDQAMNQGLGVG